MVAGHVYHGPIILHPSVSLLPCPWQSGLSAVQFAGLRLWSLSEHSKILGQRLWQLEKWSLKNYHLKEGELGPLPGTVKRKFRPLESV